MNNESTEYDLDFMEDQLWKSYLNALDRGIQIDLDSLDISKTQCCLISSLFFLHDLDKDSSYFFDEELSSYQNLAKQCVRWVDMRKYLNIDTINEAYILFSGIMNWYSSQDSDIKILHGLGLKIRNRMIEHGFIFS